MQIISCLYSIFLYFCTRNEEKVIFIRIIFTIFALKLR